MVTQFGLSIIVPPLLLLFGAAWLRESFGLGEWISLVAIVLGIGSWYPTTKKLVAQLLDMFSSDVDD